MKWCILLFIGAVSAESQSAQITPTDYDVDDISVVFGGQCDVSDGGWFLSAHTTETIVDWAIEVDLSGDYDLSDGMSTVAFTIDGEKVNKQGDIFMGFGDGEKYISFLTDFDGGVNNMEKVRGIQVYPECAKGGGILAEGDISDVLLETNSYDADTRYAVRDALAGGDRWNWEKLGGTTVHNGETWPVTIEIVNDMDANEVTFRFTSDTTTAECTYEDSFGAGGFVYGILPDTEDGDADDFHIYSIGISQTGESTTAELTTAEPTTDPTASPTSYWTVLEGYNCQGINGYDSDLLRDWEGTAEECKEKCIDLGVDCVGFIRVNVGADQHEGNCYFRSTELTDISESANGGRDCFVRNAFSTAEPTTAAPSTAEPTTAEPTTAEPTTAEPTTAEPTTPVAPSTATLTTHCDNRGDHYVSNDGGSSWTLIGTSGSWGTANSYDLDGISENTKIRVSVRDTGSIGGFIATVSYDGTSYSTTNPLSAEHWTLVSASDGITSLEYRQKTSSPWGISTEAIASDAYWVWNGQVYNTLVFEFDFGAVLSSESANIVGGDRYSNRFDDFEHIGDRDTFNAMKKTAPITGLTAKDLLILVLLVSNICMLTILIGGYTKCCQRGMSKEKKVKYDFNAEAVLSENERIAIIQ